MNRNLASLVLAAGTSAAFAQSSIAVTVTDDAGTPLPGATVTVGEAASVAGTTDDHGHCAINGVPAGTQRMRITHLGFEPVDTSAVPGSVLTIRMRGRQEVLLGIEVTSLRAGDQAPFARSTLTREAIERTNTGVDLPFLLEPLPSVVSTSDGGTGIGYTYMRIRGSDATRTNITINGVPFNDPESQGAFLVNLPDLASSAEDIEVQRGVGTSTNGPAAFGASVNLRTTTVMKDPWGTVAVSGGSYNTQRYAVSAGTGLIAGRFSLDARLSSITSDGYVDRASADLKSYFVQGAWIGEKRSLRAITFRGKEVTYQAWGGVPATVIDTNRTWNGYTYENEVDNYDQTHYQLLFDQQFGSRTRVNITLFRVDGAGYFEQFREADDMATYAIDPAVIDGDTITTTDIIRRRWLDNSLNGLNASAEVKLAAHLLVLGGSYSAYDGAHFGEVVWARYAGDLDIRDRYYDNKARKTDGNVFAKFTLRGSDRTDVFTDLQVRAVEHSFLGFNSDFSEAQQTVRWSFFNPKLGVSSRIPRGYRAYASLAVGNREPNRDDLQMTTPQSRPRSERLIDLEAGGERRTARTNAGFNLYYMHYTDQLVLTGGLNDVGAALRTNVEESYRAGIELTFSFYATKRLLWRGNATFSANRFGELTEYVDNLDADFNWLGQAAEPQTEGDLPFSPSVIASSEIAFRFWDRPMKGGATIALVTKYVGAQYLDLSTSSDRMLDAYVVNDLRLNATLLARGIRGIDVNFTVRNLFSELYESNGWVYSYVIDGQRYQDIGLYPQAPLNVMAGVSLRF